jgi:ferredoxin-thioredoxin reductase catalytic subunit
MKITLNPDKAFVETMRQAIKDNDGFCPCRLKKTPDTKCMCKEFRDGIEKGYCHCELYFKDRE